MAIESNQIGPLPRTVFQAEAAKAMAIASATGRSMCTTRARSPARAAWKKGRAEKRTTGSATPSETHRKKDSKGEAMPECSPA